MKKLTALILILVTVLSITGCDAFVDPQSSVLGAYVGNGDEREAQSSQSKTEMSALFYKDMDTNPVTTTCYANSELLKLVYSPLIRCNDRFEPYCVLAQSFSQDGLKVTVKLRDGIVFSDGTAVTASDVVKSYDAARKNAQSPYNKQTSLMSKYYAADDSTFVCVLSGQLVEPMLLFDIPVMKNGEAGVGCGPYVFSEKNGKSVLVPADSYFEKASVPLINLLETKNDENITSLFSAGELDIISNSSGSLSLTSLRDYSIISYPSNNLVYIGINSANERLSDPLARRAVSQLIDRERIAGQSLVGLADAAAYPFNPNWYKLPDSVLDSPDALNPIQALGTAELTMAVPQGGDIKKTIAQSIQESFKSAELALNIIEIDAAEFETALKSGTYDMYLCETAISRTMDPTFIYGTGGALNFGGFSDAELDALYLSLKNGETSLSDYLAKFSDSLPIIPVVFRKNVMYCDKNIDGFSAQSPWNSFGSFTGVRLK